MCLVLVGEMTDVCIFPNLGMHVAASKLQAGLASELGGTSDIRCERVCGGIQENLQTWSASGTRVCMCLLVDIKLD